MSPSTILPDRNIAAVPQQLRRAPLAGADAGADTILIPGTGPASPGGPVAAAVDDDASADAVVKQARAEARRLGVPLRVVHVWTGNVSSATGARLLRHDRMCDADCLLANVLYEALPAAEADLAEREILHDNEPVRALAALSAGLSLVVVAAAVSGGRVLSSTAAGLAGRTACPLVVVPAAEESAIW